jgi:hypothetical protein
MKATRPDEVPAWDQTALMNRHLRRIWAHVQLDEDMTPQPVWRDASYRFDEEDFLREEAELLDPEAAGLIMLDERRAAGAR